MFLLPILWLLFPIISMKAQCGQKYCGPCVGKTAMGPLWEKELRAQCGQKNGGPCAGKRTVGTVWAKQLWAQCEQKNSGPSVGKTTASPLRAKQLQTQCGQKYLRPSIPFIHLKGSKTVELMFITEWSEHFIIISSNAWLIWKVCTILLLDDEWTSLWH